MTVIGISGLLIFLFEGVLAERHMPMSFIAVAGLWPAASLFAANGAVPLLGGDQDVLDFIESQLLERSSL